MTSLLDYFPTSKTKTPPLTTPTVKRIVRNPSQGQQSPIVVRLPSPFGKKRKSPKISLLTKRARRKVIHELTDQFMNGNKDIVTQSRKIYPWLTRDMINGCARRLKIKENTSINHLINHPSTTNNAVNNQTTTNVEPINTISSKKGRPKGTTIASKLELQNKFEKAKEKITMLYSKKEKTYGRGEFKKLHDSVMQEYGLNPDKNTIIIHTIMQRINRNAMAVCPSRNQKYPYTK